MKIVFENHFVCLSVIYGVVLGNSWRMWLWEVLTITDILMWAGISTKSSKPDAVLLDRRPMSVVGDGLKK